MSTRRNLESPPEYRFLIVQPDELARSIQCVCGSCFDAAVPPSRIPRQIACTNCRQRFVLQWIDFERTHAGEQPPDSTGSHLVAVDADGHFRSVHWTGHGWMAHGKEQEVYRWFELNRSVIRSEHMYAETVGLRV